MLRNTTLCVDHWNRVGKIRKTHCLLSETTCEIHKLTKMKNYSTGNPRRRHAKTLLIQESPPAWTQEAYRPWRIKYSICCPIPAGGGVPHLWTGEGVPRGIPTLAYQVLHLLSYPGGGRGTPSLDRGRGTPWLGWGRGPSWPGTSHWGTPSKWHGTSGSIIGWRWGTTGKDMGPVEVLRNRDWDGVPPSPVWTD